MRSTSARRGFTLIELMIVVAIIAIIAAIAIPGLLSAMRAANEKAALGSLKTLASSQITFRSNDSDNNRVNDFWTLDVAALYGICPVGSAEMIRLIEVSLAGADYNPDPGASASPTAGTSTARSAFTNVSPKSGYWYRALLNDEEGNPYATDTAGVGWAGTAAAFNHSRFGVQAFPDSRSSGRVLFVLNEGNTIFRRPVGTAYRKPSSPSGDFTGLVGSSPGTKFPNDLELKSDYFKAE